MIIIGTKALHRPLASNDARRPCARPRAVRPFARVPSPAVQLKKRRLGLYKVRTWKAAGKQRCFKTSLGHRCSEDMLTECQAGDCSMRVTQPMNFGCLSLELRVKSCSYTQVHKTTLSALISSRNITLNNKIADLLWHNNYD